MNRQPRLRAPGRCLFSISSLSPYLPLMSLLTGHLWPKKTTCSSSLFRPSQKAFAGSTESQTLAGNPPAALPLLLYECNSCGTSFLLDTCESKKQEAPLLLCKFPTDRSYLLAATTMKNHCGPEMPPPGQLSPVSTARRGLAIHERAHSLSGAPKSLVHRDG